MNRFSMPRLFSTGKKSRRRRGNRYIDYVQVRRVSTFLLIIVGVILLTPMAFSNPFKTITVVDGYGEYTLLTKADDVGELYQNGILNIEQGDTTLNQAVPVRDDMVLSVDRSIVVDIVSNGEPVSVRTAQGTLEEVLDEAGIEYSDTDEFTKALDEPVANGEKVVHSVVETKTVTKEEAIPFDTETVESSAIPKGETEVLVEGTDGYKNVEYEITYKDGVEVSREAVDETIVKEPVTRKVAIGTKEETPSTESDEEETEDEEDEDEDISVPTPDKKPVITDPGVDADQVASTMTMSVTAYTHTGNNTSTGSAPGYGTVAVNPSVIPYGTKLYIPGYGYGIASDTGGFSPNTIDVFFDTYQECINWGRKTLTIYIMK